MELFRKFAEPFIGADDSLGYHPSRGFIGQEKRMGFAVVCILIRKVFREDIKSEQDLKSFFDRHPKAEGSLRQSKDIFAAQTDLLFLKEEEMFETQTCQVPTISGTAGGKAGYVR